MKGKRDERDFRIYAKELAMKRRKSLLMLSAAHPERGLRFTVGHERPMRK
jgi:hypothetical protein